MENIITDDQNIIIYNNEIYKFDSWKTRCINCDFNNIFERCKIPCVAGQRNDYDDGVFIKLKTDYLEIY